MDRRKRIEIRELERAVKSARSMLGRHVKEMLAEQERLSAMLTEREADLHNLEILIDNMAFLRHQPTAPILALHREDLLTREAELRWSIRTLSHLLARLESLSTAASSVAETDRMTSPDAECVPATDTTSPLTSGQEAERLRLAREIHDGPAQVLANAILEVNKCRRLVERSPEVAGAELQRLERSLSFSMEDLRRFIFDLRPSELEQNGLLSALRQYATEFEARTGLSVSLSCDQIENVLVARQESIIFRVIQEAMQNCHKHARATQVQITVRRHKESVEVSATDNGLGFDVGQITDAGKRYGLRGMRERAASIRANLEILSEPGQGTEIRLNVPIG